MSPEGATENCFESLCFISEPTASRSFIIEGGCSDTSAFFVKYFFILRQIQKKIVTLQSGFSETKKL